MAWLGVASETGARPAQGLLEPEEDVLGSREERLERIEEAVESLLSLVEGYSAGLAAYESRLGRLEAFLSAASMMGSWKMSRCAFYDKERGVCRLWRASGEAARRLEGLVVEADGAPRVAVSRAPWFCGLCPLYRAARQHGDA